MNFGSLFSGIGGIDLGLERAGMTCQWQVENDDFCNKVLAKHWPRVDRYGDIRDFPPTNICRPDIIVGGFPCQPHSVAGKREGAKDDRNLWPEFLRIVKELRPAWVLAENVPGIVSLYLDTVLADLEGAGYSCWPFNIPACALGAYHKRARIFVVAYANARFMPQATAPVRPGRDAAELMVQPLADTISNGEGLEGKGIPWATTYGTSWLPEPALARVVYGPPTELDKARIRALGNAVVPQVAEWIGRQILDANLTIP